ncbi:MAG: sugar isomerase domain-containing protein [Oscillospiraceae bacterium]|nr:sugar isomerase domain-containing protein [Oscillospiraceae bacterium]
MLLDTYRKSVDDLFAEIRETQTENIIKAGALIADSIKAGGNIYLSGICHYMEYDVLDRGGGPAFYKPFHYNLDLTNHTSHNQAHPRPDLPVDGNMEGLAAYALKKAHIGRGDVLFVGSVSGRTASVVDLAYEAEKRGVRVIAFTSMKYARAVDAVHSSGKKLYEMVTLVIDNCAPAAEAMLEVKGLDSRYAAASGIASDYSRWSITSVAVDELLRRGKAPGILRSANFPGGIDYNEGTVYPNYNKTGF